MLAGAFPLLLAILIGQAAVTCPANICTPSSMLTWTQPDGTTAVTGWLVKYAPGSYVCTTIHESVKNYTFFATPNAPGPMSVNVQLSMFPHLTNGRWFFVVRGVYPDGTLTPCSPEINFEFRTQRAAQPPTDLRVCQP